MRWVFASLCSAALAATLANLAQAQSATDSISENGAAAASFLSVTRDEGADSCPDTESLRAHVERLRGHQPTGEPSAYRVRFSYRGGVYRATIQVGAGSAARELHDRGATCASLEQATAVTLALLLDSDTHELPPEKREPVSPPPPRPSKPQPAEQSPPDPERRRRATSLSLAVGGAAVFGLVQPVVPAALAEAGIGVNRFRTSIGVLWMPEQTLDFGPGQIRETLVSGVARTCLTAVRGEDAHFDLCSGIYAGLLKVRAEHYTVNDSADKAWLALPLEVSLGTTASPVGVEVGASALLPLRRNDFSIDHLGVAYASWPVGMMLSFRAVGRWLL
jgi:hypothetical protein